MNKNINNVFHGTGAKTSRETQAVPEGLFLELSGEVVNKKERPEMFLGRSPCQKGGW